LTGAAWACASADGGLFFFAASAEKHAGAVGFGVDAHDLPAVIFIGADDPKNLTRAAEGGGEVGDLLLWRVEGRGRI